MIISIITPTFNSEKTIGRTVKSVLKQDFTDYEHIIVDNQSIDGTLGIVKALYENEGKTEKLKIISEPDEGISDAFNKGIRVSEGRIIGILNSDDYYYDETVLSRIGKALSDKSVLFAHGDIFFEDPVFGSNIRRPLLCPVRITMPFNHPTMFFRREIYKDFGNFDRHFKYAMDFEFLCRLENLAPGILEKGCYVAGPPLVYMKSGGASWEHEEKAIKEIKKALKKNKLWQADSQRAYYTRLGRNILKKYISMAGLEAVVKLWRRLKWRN